MATVPMFEVICDVYSTNLY